MLSVVVIKRECSFIGKPKKQQQQQQQQQGNKQEI
jgi:hypothetical protein